MRPTLRTMLAYLDDILDPSDAEELGKKIEESEFAGTLIHRIRASMRRLRLGAPKLGGKGMGVDPNTVAEYLDSTLPAERVSDFEVVCLESDVHLAEVASCHQILTLVLGEPAVVPTTTRQRVYRVGMPGAAASAVADTAEIEQPVASGEPPLQSPPVARETVVAAGAAASVQPRQEADVPDYLKTGGGIRMLKPALVMVLLAFALTAVIIYAMGPLDATHPLAGWVGIHPPEETAQGSPADTTGSNGQPTSPADADTPAIPPQPPAILPENPATPETAEQPVDPVFNPNTVAPAEGTEPAPIAPPVEGEEPAPIAPPVEPPADEGTSPPQPTDPMPEMPGPTPPEPGIPGESDTPTEATDVPIEPAPPTESSPEAPADLGRFLSEDQVLLRYDTPSHNWLRVEPRATLSSGNQLFVLPFYRPQLMLAGPVQATPLGETMLQLGRGSDPNAVSMTIYYGRVLLMTVGSAGASIDLQMGSRQGRLTFSDADSTAAIEIRFVRLPGVDPEASQPGVAVDLFATGGKLVWTEQNQPPLPLEAGQVHTMFGDADNHTAIVEQPPEWIQATPNEIDYRAARTVASLLRFDRPASLTLEELAEDRRIEVRTHACRSLAHFGRFGALVATLDDPSMKASWPVIFDSLCAAIDRGSDEAKQIHAAFASSGDPVLAARQCRMLWGYSDRDLRNGGMAELVKGLDSPSMAERVLAFENTRRITGMTYMYRPEYDEKRRRPAVSRFEERLESGDLLPPAGP